MKSALVLIAIVGVSMAYPRQMRDGSKDPKVLPKLQREFSAAQQDFSSHPKDPKARSRYLIAGTRYGHETMMSPILGAKVKYAQALRIYRKVLKVDPNYPVAKEESDMMIRIYKQLHKPIPN